MGYPQERRRELWFAISVALVLFLAIAGIAILQRELIVFFFAVPFALVLPILLWKVKKSDKVFEAELKREERFIQNHPIFSILLLVASTLCGIWYLVTALSKT
ncbi:MAG: hypothetical protein ACSHYB_11030 [Roseibacillus sp.]